MRKISYVANYKCEMEIYLQEMELFPERIIFQSYCSFNKYKKNVTVNERENYWWSFFFF